MGASAGKPTDVDRAICRIVEETSARGTLKYFGPGVLVKFESTEFLNSVGTPKSNYFLVASNQVLRKVPLQKKSKPSVIMVAEFQDLKVGGKLERKPLNELYSSLEDDVFEYAGITYVALTKLRASGFRKSSLLSRALEGMCSLATSDQLQCIVLCNERTINRDKRDMDELSTKVYDLLQFDSILARDELRFPRYFLRNEDLKRFVREDEFQNCDGEPFGSIILTRDSKFGGVLNFIENQPAPVFVGSGFGAAASERHDDIPEREMNAGASGGIYPLLDPQPKSEVGTETEIWEVAEPAVTPLTRNQFGAVVNREGELQEKKDFSNGKQSPTENSYRSFNSLPSKAEVEQDLKGEVLVVDLPPGNGSKEALASVEPEHANNNNEEPSVQDPEEQLRNLYNYLRVQATNNRKDSSVQDPAEPLRDQDDDASVHRRNNNGPLAEAPLGETDDERADPNDVLHNVLQGRSGGGSHQGQDGAASGIALDQRRQEQRDLSDSPDLSDEPTSTSQANQRPRQRSLLTYAPGKRAAAAATSTNLNRSEFEDLSSSVSPQTSEVNSDTVSEHLGRLPGRRRSRQRSSGESVAPQSAANQSENTEVSETDTETSQQETLRESNGNTGQQQYANGARTRRGSAGKTKNEGAPNCNITMDRCTGAVMIGNRNSLTIRSKPKCEFNGNTDQQQYADKARTRKGSAGTTKTENKGASNCNIEMDGCSGPVMLGDCNSLITGSTPQYESNAFADQQQNANEARTRQGSANNTETENEDASNCSVRMTECSGPVVLGHHNYVNVFDET